MSDTIKITILDDGTIKTETDEVSVANHSNAEGFLRDMQKLAGGTVDSKHKQGHSHTHGNMTHSH